MLYTLVCIYVYCMHTHRSSSIDIYTIHLYSYRVTFWCLLHKINFLAKRFEIFSTLFLSDKL